MRKEFLIPLLLAAGCSSTGPELPPAVELELPDSWKGSTTENSESVAVDWWRSFGHAEMERAVDDALTNNPDLAAAAARVVAAEARGRAVAGSRWPAIDFGFQAGRGRNVLVGFPSPTGDGLAFTTNQFGASLNLSWEVDLWDRIGSMTRAAMNEFEATASDYNAARLSLAGQAAKTWVTWQAAREQLDLARAAVKLAEDQSKLLKRRFRQGAATAEQVVEAESDISKAVAALLDFEINVDQAARAVELLAGRYPGGMDVEPGEQHLPELPAPPPAGMPAELLARRPDLQSAELRVAAAREGITTARANLYPRLALTASGGSTSASLGDLLDGDFKVWSLGANLTAPLFQGGRLRAEADEAEARAREAELRFAGALLGAFAEVEAALQTESRILARIGELDSAVRNADTALRLADGRYAHGAGDPIAIFQAREDARQARRLLIEARRRLLTNRIDLHLALGGDFVTPTS